MSRSRKCDVSSLYKHAEELYNQFVEEHAQNQKKSVLSDLSTAGTLEDRISSLSLQISASPVHNLTSILALHDILNNARKSVRTSVISALVDLYTNTLIPPNSTLTSFSERPLSPSTPESDLIQWYFEDKVKFSFSNFLSSLRAFSLDTIYYHRQILITASFNLIKGTLEQQGEVLSVMASRLTDPDKRLASQAADKMLKLVMVPSNPKPKKLERIAELKHNLVNAVVEVLTIQKGKSTSYHGRLFGLHFLASLVLDEERDLKLCRRLMTVYGKMLNVILEAIQKDVDEAAKPVVAKKRSKRRKKGKKASKEDDSQSNVIGVDPGSRTRLLMLILKGLSTCIQVFGQSIDFFDSLKDHFDPLFRLLHFAPLSTVSKILEILKSALPHAIDSSSSMNIDRFYRSLYNSLMHEDINKDSARLGPYFDLIYQTIRDDPHPIRPLSFCHRLLSLAINNWTCLAVGILLIISEVGKGKPEVLHLLDESESDILSVLRDRLDDDIKSIKKDDCLSYDCNARDPRSCGWGALWGFDLLRSHFHPTVVMYSKNLSSKNSRKFLNYDGDPFADFSVNSFLDKFSVRNPKQITSSFQSSHKIDLVLGDAGKVLRTYFADQLAKHPQSQGEVDLEKVAFDDHEDPDDGFDSEVEAQLLKAVEQEEAKIQSGVSKVFDYSDMDESELEEDMLDETGAVMGFSDVEEDDLIDFSKMAGDEVNVSQVSAFADADDYEQYINSDEEEKVVVEKESTRKRKKGRRGSSKKGRK
ncbi:hypothetical protein GEMRC1_000972 [Eukaryota sp. GEM-RC1]